MTFDKGSFASADGKSRSAYTLYRPDGKPRAAVLLSHGMCEYTERYKPVAEYFAERGFAFCGADHIGHGDTAGSDTELGYIPREGGRGFLREDLHTMRKTLEDAFPDTPVFLYGHSMGSFIARYYAVKYSAGLRGVVFSGTAGPNPACGAGKAAASAVAAAKGRYYRSGFLNSLAFGSYNSRIPSPVSKHDWLTRDAGVVEKYDADKYCNYIFTADGFWTLFDLISAVSAKEWFSAYPAELPTLIISGAEDPVGNYGKGPGEVYRRLDGRGVKDITLHLCPGARHEPHNETDREEHLKYICDWMENRL